MVDIPTNKDEKTHTAKSRRPEVSDVEDIGRLRCEFTPAQRGAFQDKPLFTDLH